MTLLERIEEDFRKAMKAHDAGRVSVLRVLRSSIINAVIAARTSAKQTLDDNDVEAVVRLEVKRLKDALQDFTKAAREDLISKTKEELEILSDYLPQELDSKELKAMVTEVVSILKKEGQAEFGKVMQAVMKKTKGRADGKVVSSVVKETLEKDK